MGNVCPFQIQCGDSFINRCWDCTSGQAEYICQLEHNLEALQIAREELRELKDDVIRRLGIEEGGNMKRREQVQGWLLRVEAKITEVDELIGDGPQEIQKLCLGGCCSKNLKSSYTFGRRVVRGLQDVAALKSKGDFEVFVERSAREPVIERPIEPTAGLEGMLDRVWNCLIEEAIGLVGIYGMGGVGKTTLLTRINNKFLDTPHDFDVVIWVVVSKDLRLEKVQEEIAKKIGLSNDGQWQHKSFSEKAAEIFQVLRKKKFVLLLDDIWKRVELKDVGVPIPKTQNRSKIVFTTRSRAVCSYMEAEQKIKVEPLAWEKAWELFQEKVGVDTLDADPDIPNIAEEVARECAGLPLALITVGRAMACKKTPQEWRYAVEVLRVSASNMQVMGDEVFPILKFSYDSLPNYKIKSCFLYCTLYPEDYKISKDELIEHWMCENFWDEGHNQVDAFNEGYNIIGMLVHACLLEHEGSSVKMHDVIRDMALWITCEVEKEEHKYLVQAGAQSSKAPEIERWRGKKRVSLMENNIEQLTEVPRCPDLVTLFLCGNGCFRSIPDDFFQFMNALTVLDVSETALKFLPNGISGLVALQYLNLSRTKIKQLPPELMALRKLKYLNLEHNYDLHSIPSKMMSGFPLLQVLRMFSCGVVCHVQDEGAIYVETLLLLKHLKVLSFTIRHAYVLHRFLTSHKLLSCTQALSLQDLRDPEFSSSTDMQPKNAAAQALGGLRNPARLRKRNFDRLRHVDVTRCLLLQDLTWLILAPNLTELYVSKCENLEEIISSAKLGAILDKDENLNPFPRLKVLKLYQLLRLKSIYWNALPFPFLQEITVIDCPLLQKLPLNNESARGQVVIIEAEKHWWDSVQWENEASKTAFQFCFQDLGRRS
ncbi:probable disease resistance protein At5g63020 [Manihot esculenta]|uniref:Uncharacterized protein n=1 Tax=Manihot esculenta TaxID=3983 RepID=A0A2C9W3T9_MANES|nr:probable disease resistance protein At5g63020 [Manihot esculenta]OAY52843.1 hypothetical protein MANES_04G115600v8 [Manihot esculenta]